MGIENIVLELMGRIQELEKAKTDLETRVLELEKNNKQKKKAISENIESPETLDGQGMHVPRQKMTEKKIEACYRCAADLATGRLQNEDLAVQQAATENKINASSAKMYVYVVGCMLCGETYKRAISSTATRQYLKFIEQDFGEDGLKKALQALEGHILYRHECGQTVSSLKKILQEYRKGGGLD